MVVGHLLLVEYDGRESEWYSFLSIQEYAK